MREKRKNNAVALPVEIASQLANKDISTIDRCKLAERCLNETRCTLAQMLEMSGIPATTYYKCRKILYSGNDKLIEKVSQKHLSIHAAVCMVDNGIEDKGYSFISQYAALYIKDGNCCLELLRSKRILLFNAECTDILAKLLKSGFYPNSRGMRHYNGRHYNYNKIAISSLYGYDIDDLRLGGVKNTNIDPDDYRSDRLGGTGVIANWWLSRTKTDIYLFMRTNDGVKVYAATYRPRLWDVLLICQWRLTSGKYPAYYHKGRNLYFHSIVWYEYCAPDDFTNKDILNYAARSRRSIERNIAHLNHNECDNRISNLADMPYRYHRQFDKITKTEGETR